MSPNIAPSAVIQADVLLGQDATVGDYALIGVAYGTNGTRNQPTQIGAGAIIRSHTVIYAGNVIGDRFQTGHGVMVRELNRIGNDVSIGTHSIIEHNVILGNKVRVHSNAFIPEYSVLDDGVWVGPNVVLTNAQYPLSPGAKHNLKGPHLLTAAKIGANATILPGVIIGQNALVGAGSVVVRDVLDGEVVVGNPARVIRHISELTAYQVQQLVNS